MEASANMIPVMIGDSVVGYVKKPQQPYARFYEFGQDIPPALPAEYYCLRDRISLTVRRYDNAGFPEVLCGEDISLVSKIYGFKPIEKGR